MKRIHVIFVVEENNKFFAKPEAIRTGENLKPIFERNPCVAAHLCESATQAHNLAAVWNETFKKNGTNLL